MYRRKTIILGACRFWIAHEEQGETAKQYEAATVNVFYQNELSSRREVQATKLALQLFCDVGSLPVTSEVDACSAPPVAFVVTSKAARATLRLNVVFEGVMFRQQITKQAKSTGSHASGADKFIAMDWYRLEQLNCTGGCFSFRVPEKRQKKTGRRFLGFRAPLGS